jgi:NADH:ubiquinone oxidoreductase subunit F (NADH-binding)
LTATSVCERTTLLEHGAADYEDHVGRNGPVPMLSPERIRQLAADCGLTGRGGAGFPIGRKLATVAANAGRSGAVVIANGAEGEPASSKDRYLLIHAPHLVFDGLLLAVRAVGAVESYVYAPRDLLAYLEDAAAQRADAAAIRFVAAPGAFVSGQETAAVAAVEGREALPRTVPPAVFKRGVRGLATLVQNVETLAQLGLIARYGPHWFRSVGSAGDPGTRLITVSGAVARAGVYETETGRTLGSLLALAGGASEPVRALLVGGYHGGWVPWTAATAALPYARSDLAPFNAAPGAGVIIALPISRCGLQATADIASYLAGQSAGQCGPCRNGLPTLAGHLHTLAYGHADASLPREIARICGLVDGRGACAHPNGTVRLIASGMRAFDDEIRHHRSGRCTAAQARRNS